MVASRPVNRLILDVVPIVFALTALFLFVRWKETADRSSYAIGAAFAITAPVLVASFLVAILLDIGSYMEAAADDWVATTQLWASIAGGIGYVVLCIRPWFLTGMFAFAAQQTIRQRFHAIETSWQYAAAIAGTAYLINQLLRVYQAVMLDGSLL